MIDAAQIASFNAINNVGKCVGLRLAPLLKSFT
jgi:hypothetical protein